MTNQEFFHLRALGRDIRNAPRTQVVTRRAAKTAWKSLGIVPRGNKVVSTQKVKYIKPAHKF